MSFRPKYLAHVNIYVRDVERSHEWYADVLGLHTYDYRPSAAAFMSADQDDSHEIALMQVGQDAPLFRRLDRSDSITWPGEWRASTI